MRALYLPQHSFHAHNDLILIENDDFHHLINVLRMKESQTVLLLNGQGEKAWAQIESIAKKSLSLKITQVIDLQNSASAKMNYSILCGQTKKSTCEQIWQQCIELGVSHCYFWQSEYSQSFPLDERRMHLIAKNAYEQSNNPWQSHWEQVKSLTPEFLASWDLIIFLDLFSNTSDVPMVKSDLKKYSATTKTLLMIGPEGGFSLSERHYIAQNVSSEKLKYLMLPTPILRAETAVVAAVGHFLGQVFL